jgi:hypothetical protein
VDDAAVTYLKTFHDQVKFYGTWLPGLRIKVGEVGRIDDDGLYRYSTELANVGIDVDTETVPYQDVQFATEGSVEVSGGVGAKTAQLVSTIAGAKGAFTISFSRENAVVVILREVRLERVKDEEKLRRDMLAAWNDAPRRLETDHVVITKVFSARSGTLAMAAESAARVEAATSVDIAPGKIELADISGKLSIVSTDNTRFAISAAADDPPLTPMFEMLHFAKNRPWYRFWRPVLAAGTRGLGSPADLDDSTDPGEVIGLDQV